MNITKLLPLLFCSMLSLSLSLQPTDAGVPAAGAGSSAAGSSASVFELAEGDKYPEIEYESNDRWLIDAIRNRDMNTFNTLLLCTKNLDSTYCALTPLMHACEQGRLEMVQTLLDKGGFNISCYYRSFYTALSLAACYNSDAKNYATANTSRHPKVGFDNGSITLPFVATFLPKRPDEEEISNRIEIVKLLLAKDDLKVHSDGESSKKIKVFLKGIVGDKALSLEDRLRMIHLFLSYKVLPVADLLFPDLTLRSQLEVDNEAKKHLKKLFFFDIDTKRRMVGNILAQEKGAGESDEKYEERINTKLKDVLKLSDKAYEAFQALRHFYWSSLRQAWVHAVAVPSAALHGVGGAGAGSSVDSITDKDGK